MSEPFRGVSGGGPGAVEPESGRISRLASFGKESHWGATIAGCLLMTALILALILVPSPPPSHGGSWPLPNVSLRRQLTRELQAAGNAAAAAAAPGSCSSCHGGFPQAGQVMARLSGVLHEIQRAVPNSDCGRAAAGALADLSAAAGQWGSGNLGSAVTREGSRLELAFTDCTAYPRPVDSGMTPRGFPSILFGP